MPYKSELVEKGGKEKKFHGKDWGMDKGSSQSKT